MDADVVIFEERSSKMDATDLEENPKSREDELERQKLRKGETYVDAIGSSEDRYGGRRLDMRRRRWTKKWIHDGVGSGKKLAAGQTRKIRRAVPAVRKGYMRKGPSRDGIAREAPRGRRLQKTKRNAKQAYGAVTYHRPRARRSCGQYTDQKHWGIGLSRINKRKLD
jgi:hypothetical protein